MKFKRRLRLFSRWLSRWQRAGKIYRFWGIVLLIFWLTIILGYFLPISYVFEGNLTVDSLSFTYNGNTDKRLLNEITGVKNLDIMGSNSQAVVLEGNFSSNSDLELDRKLKTLPESKLKIEFPYPTSRLILKVACEGQPQDNCPDNSSSLSLLSLPIKPGTKVQQFAYNSDRQELSQLSFCLQSPQESAEACSYPESLIGEQSRQPQEVGSLQVQLGQQPLAVSLENVNLPQLKIKTEIDAPTFIDFQYQPTDQESTLQLSSPTQVYIHLPELPAKSQAREPEWLGEDFAVQDVRFSRPKKTGNVTEEIQASTILAGEIRLKKEKLELQPQQFLIVEPPQPGIQRLRSLGIKTKEKDNKVKDNSARGLQVFVSGKSSLIAAGLYPNFPVEEIQFNWLSNFPQEAINTILAFLGALTAILLPHIFPDSPK